MTEREKAAAGYLYDANYDQELQEERNRCKDLCHAFNACLPSDMESQQKILKHLLNINIQRHQHLRRNTISVFQHCQKHMLRSDFL